MKVILKENVKNLGMVGSVVDVKPFLYQRVDLVEIAAVYCAIELL